MEVFKLVDKKYTFGTPQRLTDKSLNIVVPIIREFGTDREYLVSEEVLDKLEVKDSGKINELHIKSRSDKPVFVRSGSTFKGHGTQSRAVTCGIVIMPEIEETIKSEHKIPSVCIHASHPIRSGAKFMYSSLAPISVSRYFAGINTKQHSVWSAVSHYSQSMQSRYGSALSDSLINTMEEVQSFKKDIDKIIENIKREENQVGIIILDEKGVLGLEFFDNPDSWNALVKSIIKSYEESLLKQDSLGIFDINMDRIKSLCYSFLQKLKECKDESVLYQSDNTKSVSFKNTEIAGEYTMLNDKLIHIIVTRSEEQKQESHLPSFQPDRIFGTIHEYPAHRIRSNHIIGTYRTCDNSKTFSDLLEETKVSRPTLSKWLKKGVDNNLITKVIEDGKPIYRITAKGLYYKE